MMYQIGQYVKTVFGFGHVLELSAEGVRVQLQKHAYWFRESEVIA